MSKFILIITAVFPPEPVVSARISMDLYQELARKGYAVKVLHPEPTRPLGFKPDVTTIGLLGDNEIIVDSYTCPQSSTIGRVKESLSFGKVCRKYIQDHYNEISCVYANSWPMFSQKAIVEIARKYRIPCAIHVQDVYPESLTNKLNGLLGGIVNAVLLPMDKYILGNCSQIVAISEKMKLYLAKTRCIISDKIAVVTNWQDESEFVNIQPIEEVRPFTFMYMGNIGPVAGVDLLIDAFVNAGLINARLIIAGSGSMKEELQIQAALYNNVEFWDVPNGKVPEIQSQADCMLLPIRKGAASSSIPSKLPAYMFSAKPIIGCVDADSDTANAIKDAKCGWVIEPERIDLLADKMRMVSTIGTSALKEKGQNAQKYALKHFSKAVNLSKLVSVIESIC